MAEVLEKKPKSVSRAGYGILYKDGSFWSRERYDTAEAAKSGWEAFWRLPGFKAAPPCSDYTIVKVRQTMTYAGRADHQ